MTNPQSTLIERDQKVIWHPYSQHGLQPKILPVASAKGAYLKLSDGREILDAISSWWVNIHGHAHPRIVEAIRAQAEKLEHVIFSGFTHEPGVRLAELLLSYDPIRKAQMSKVFYSDNGSTAVEVALKMAYQYHWNQGSRSRYRFIALNHSYHGDTLGAMAVGEPTGFHEQFRRLMPQVDFVEPGNLEQLARLLKENPDSYCAFIFEPLIQGASGMRVYSATFLEEAIQLCRKHRVLTIADEVFTGFFRTGKCLAIERTAVRPDLICLSKGITGGFMPLAVTLCTEEIFKGFISQDVREAFLHGHSYTANPIACAAAIESWAILHEEGTQRQIEQICVWTQQRVEKFRDHPRVQDARVLGTIGAIELKADLNYFSGKSGSFMNRALEQGVLIRPLGGVFYAVPPYCCTQEEISRIYQVIAELIA